MRASFDRSALPYWEARAASWKVASPLSPTEDDVRFYSERARLASKGGEQQALVLGMTPSIVLMDWTAGTRLVALDWASRMIARLWPAGQVRDGFFALRGDWREIPLASSCVDFAVGDGCYSTFADLEGAAAMNREVHRVLRTGGEFCLRCFRRPDKPAGIPALFETLFAGRYRNLDMFRWLLAMAVQGESPAGVSVNAVWRVWHDHVADPELHRERLGWAAEGIANMERWRELETRYVFPTLAEIEALVAPHFELVACDMPAYEWGEYFPRLVMRRGAG